MYRVTVEVNKDQLIKLIDEGLVPMVWPLAEIVEKPAAPQRAARGSKVNDAIVEALKGGSTSISDLKGALVNAGLSAGSVSTGLAQLQKSGVVVKADGGGYALAA